MDLLIRSIAAADAGGSAGHRAASPGAPRPARGWRWEADSGSTGVSAWADGPIPHPPPADQRSALRDWLRSKIPALVAGPGEVLHATFCGERPPNSDVENLLLYNIDQGGRSFAPAVGAGVRFEWDGARAPMPEPWSARFAYAIARREHGFRYWDEGTRLASVTAAPLGSASPSLAEVWWATAHAVKTRQPRATAVGPDDPFVVRACLSTSASGARPELIKAVLDGIVCALQAHGTPSTAPELAARVGRSLDRDPREVEALLLSTEQAVLGVREKLLWAYPPHGVQWNPSDHNLVAGEVLIEPCGDCPPMLRAAVSRAAPKPTT